MFIDVHVHTQLFPGPNRPGTDSSYASPEQLIELLTPYGVRRAFILPGVNPEGTHISQSVGEVIAITEKYPDFFIPFMNLDPRALNNSPRSDLGCLMRFWKERGCRGIGEVSPNLPFEDPRMQNLFAHAQAERLPLTFHLAPGEGGHYGIIDRLGLPGLENALKKYPELVFIGHSQPFWAEISGELQDSQRNSAPSGRVAPGGATVRLFRQYPNLYGDLSPTSGSGYKAISRDPEFGYRFMEEFQDRLLFGSDICHPNPKMFLFDFLNDAVENGRISRCAYEKIAYRNAARLLNVDL